MISKTYNYKSKLINKIFQIKKAPSKRSLLILVRKFEN